MKKALCFSISMLAAVLMGLSASADQSLCVEPSAWTYTSDGALCTIDRPLIYGGSGTYVIAYKLCDENGALLEVVESDEAQAVISCPRDSLCRVMVEISDGLDLKVLISDWFDTGAVLPVEAHLSNQSTAPVLLPVAWF